VSRVRVPLKPKHLGGHHSYTNSNTRLRKPAAGKGGAPERSIMRQTGHRSERMVRKDIRADTLSEENVAHTGDAPICISNGYTL
jgi:hypothetical protein